MPAAVAYIYDAVDDLEVDADGLNQGVCNPNRKVLKHQYLFAVDLKLSVNSKGWGLLYGLALFGRVHSAPKDDPGLCVWLTASDCIKIASHQGIKVTCQAVCVFEGCRLLSRTICARKNHKAILVEDAIDVQQHLWCRISGRGQDHS
ncbi:hypothetical protein D3C73_1277780 [compost metagenome]